MNSTYIYDNAYFWLVTGILIYVGFTFFFNILANSLHKDFINKYFIYSYFGDILKNILFAIAVFYFAKQKNSKPTNESLNVPYLDMI